MRILGVSCDFHDAAAALLVDGAVVAAAEEERFSRRKHDSSVPAGAIEACLRTAGIEAAEVDVVAFYERPATVISRFLASRQRQGPSGLASFVRDAPSLVSKNLMVGYRIDRVLRGLGARDSPEFLYVDHHRSHAAAAFLASPFETAAVLTVDGIGEWATASVGRGVGSRVDMMEELRYPDSIGLVYSFVTAFCGFRPNDDEYKVMGLAPYGRPRFREALESVVELFEDGSVRVQADRMSWFRPRGLRRRNIEEAFGGPARDPDSELTQREADLAASVQQFLEESMLRLAGHAMRSTGETRLCLAGGVALNCVANGRILRETPVSDLWIQPAAGDAGSAVGAALSVWCEVLGHERDLKASRDAMGGALLGPAASPAEVRAWLRERGIAHRHVPDDAERCELVAERLEGGAIVGWFRGRMEFGPRALGNRSILADPRPAGARQHVNLTVKGREAFRPFAPAVLAEHATEWFDLDGPSPYMLIVAPLLDERLVEVEHEPEAISDRAGVVRSEVPACTHVDGTARIQTVHEEVNPVFHRLLSAFQQRTDCPMLLNTSFNTAGEPIVASPEDALATAAAAGLDLLVLEDCVIEKTAWSAEPRPDGPASTGPGERV